MTGKGNQTPPCGGALAFYLNLAQQCFHFGEAGLVWTFAVRAVANNGFETRFTKGLHLGRPDLSADR